MALPWLLFLSGDFLNLIDAIKSGRPFRRPKESTGSTIGGCYYCNLGEWVDSCASSSKELKEDLTADDWELMEPTVTIINIPIPTRVDRHNELIKLIEKWIDEDEKDPPPDLPEEDFTVTITRAQFWDAVDCPKPCMVDAQELAIRLGLE